MGPKLQQRWDPYLGPADQVGLARAAGPTRWRPAPARRVAELPPRRAEAWRAISQPDAAASLRAS